MNFLHSESRFSEKHNFLSAGDSLETHHNEFDQAFSLESLHVLANEDPLLRADVNMLIAKSHLYAQDLSLLDDAIKHDIDTQSLLVRQQKHHTEFVDALETLVKHAREQGKDFPYDVLQLSRTKSAQLALFLDHVADSFDDLDHMKQSA